MTAIALKLIEHAEKNDRKNKFLILFFKIKEQAKQKVIKKKDKKTISFELQKLSAKILGFDINIIIPDRAINLFLNIFLKNK